MTAPGTYDIGTEILLQATFENQGGTLTDPSSVVCRVIDPSGSITVLPATLISTGVYETGFVPALSGTHWFRYEGTGAVTAAKELRFLVNVERVPPAS